MSDSANAKPKKRERSPIPEVQLERRRAADRAYALAHREEARARKRAYREAHRDEVRAKGRAYYLAHRDERLAAQAARRRANPDRERAYREANAEKRRLAAAARWRARAARRGEPFGPCDICRDVVRRMWDHDHRTGKARGWLCHRCNVGLGYFRDDPELLAGAMAYLLPAIGRAEA